jgi:L-lactate dehydrogenase complex protein LldE
MPATSSSDAPRVALFVTCLADLYRPSVGFAAIKLLEAAGCEVAVPELQTCCGQPAYNSGDFANAAALARQVIEVFEAYDYTVLPSGSCTGMIRHYPRLFEDEPGWQARARALAQRTHELSSFLVDVRGARAIHAHCAASATYHDSCAGLRELGIKTQPRALLEEVEGLELKEMPDTEVCCGFGGTFCVKYPEISGRMVADKAAAIQASGAQMLLGGDLGCLLNIAGRLKAEGRPVRVYHVAEVLAGMTDHPALGEPDEREA